MNRDLIRVMREIAPETDPESFLGCSGEKPVYRIKCPLHRSELAQEYGNAISALKGIQFTQICAKTNGTEVYHVVK